jgi:hypothetical protein
MLGPCFQKMHTNAHSAQCLDCEPGHTRSGTLIIYTVIDSHQCIWCCVISRRSLDTPSPKHPSRARRAPNSPVAPKGLQCRFPTKDQPSVGRYNRFTFISHSAYSKHGPSMDGAILPRRNCALFSLERSPSLVMWSPPEFLRPQVLIYSRPTCIRVHALLRAS